MDSAFVYVDDILIFSNNGVDHISHIVSFAEKCTKHGILLSNKKAEIMKPRIEFLGLRCNIIFMKKYIISK